ncbi:hypothetical protein [Halogeometricum borinquense]|uniref:hypothetical protein n=1 Tax=Halogeometricum borinquense TaxID=60847 RepID=UPI00341BE274
MVVAGGEAERQSVEQANRCRFGDEHQCIVTFTNGSRVRSVRLLEAATDAVVFDEVV